MCLRRRSRPVRPLSQYCRLPAVMTNARGPGSLPEDRNAQTKIVLGTRPLFYHGSDFQLSHLLVHIRDLRCAKFEGRRQDRGSGRGSNRSLRNQAPIKQDMPRSERVVRMVYQSRSDSKWRAAQQHSLPRSISFRLIPPLCSDKGEHR